MPCPQSAEGPWVLRVSTADDGRSVGSEYRIRLARSWKREASSWSMPRWRNWTWACVHASATARSNVAGSRYSSARARASSREDATSVENVTRAVAPGASRTRRRRLKIGSSTAPTVLESGWPSMTDSGVRIPRPRPRNRARSVSYCTSPTVSPATTITCAAQTWGSPCDRGRRVASRAPSLGAHSVCTKRLENAGWAMSAAGGASTISAYEVSSISRVCVPRLVIDTRRTSASCSGDTTMSSVVVIVPSRRRIST